jgi:hypothetical protein
MCMEIRPSPLRQTSWQLRKGYQNRELRHRLSSKVTSMLLSFAQYWHTDVQYGFHSETKEPTETD